MMFLMLQARSKEHLNDVWSCLNIYEEIALKNSHSMFYNLTIAPISPLKMGTKTTVIDEYAYTAEVAITQGW